MLQEMKDNIRTNRERLDIYQARAEDFEEIIMAKMDANQRRMEANMNAWRNEMKAR
jgi:hypothetical protein